MDFSGSANSQLKVNWCHCYGDEEEVMDQGPCYYGSMPEDRPLDLCVDCKNCNSSDFGQSAFSKIIILKVNSDKSIYK